MDLFSRFSHYFHLFLIPQIYLCPKPKDIQNNQRAVTYPENIHNEKMKSDYFMIILTIKPNGNHQMAKAFIVLIQTHPPAAVPESQRDLQQLPVQQGHHAGQHRQPGPTGRRRPHLSATRYVQDAAASGISLILEKT